MPDLLALVQGGLAVFLLANILAGLGRVARGPGPVDRMMAVQLLSTLGIAAVLLLGAVRPVEGVVDVALVLAVLAALVAVTFARRTHGPGVDDQARGDEERGDGERGDGESGDG